MSTNSDFKIGLDYEEFNEAKHRVKGGIMTMFSNEDKVWNILRKILLLLS